MTKYIYESISESQLPESLRGTGTGRWDIPTANQGQMVEVSYSSGRPGFAEKAVQGLGDMYRRSIDRSSDPHGQNPSYERLVTGMYATWRGGECIYRGTDEAAAYRVYAKAVRQSFPAQIDFEGTRIQGGS